MWIEVSPKKAIIPSILWILFLGAYTWLSGWIGSLLEGSFLEGLLTFYFNGEFVPILNLTILVWVIAIIGIIDAWLNGAIMNGIMMVTVTVVFLILFQPFGTIGIRIGFGESYIELVFQTSIIFIALISVYATAFVIDFYKGFDAYNDECMKPWGFTQEKFSKKDRAKLEAYYQVQEMKNPVKSIESVKPSANPVDVTASKLGSKMRMK